MKILYIVTGLGFLLWSSLIFLNLIDSPSLKVVACFSLVAIAFSFFLRANSQ